MKEEFIIDKYNPKRDKAQIELMLLNNNYLIKRFNNDEECNKDNILVALVEATPIGYLSFSGFDRRPQATLFVSEKYDAMNIGSMLIKKYESILIPNEKVEHTIFTCFHCDNELIRVFKNNGYRLYFSEFLMERISESFPLDEITVRNYDDNDYFQWDRICELALYHLRQMIGVYPSYFYIPAEWEREKFANNKDNMFVMIVDNTIVAIGEIEGNLIHRVAVSVEHQSRGYGRAFVKYLINEILSRGEDKVILEVAKDNFAKTLYESLGFKETKFYQHYVKYFRPDTRLSAPPDNY